MRQLAAILGLMVFAALLSGCKRPAPPEANPEDSEAEPAISTADIARLRDPDLKVRLEAVKKLSGADTVPSEAVEPLIAMFGDKAALDATTRTSAVTHIDTIPAVVALTKCGNAAIGPLIRTLNSESVDARGYAAMALGNMGPMAAAALPALEQPGREKFLGPILEKAIAHFRISMKTDALRRLVAAVRGQEPEVLELVALGLYRCGPAVAEFDEVFVPLIELKGGHRWTRWAELASELGPGAKRAGAAVAKRIVEEQDIVGISNRALSQFGPALAPGLSEFRKMRAKKENGRYMLDIAIKSIGPVETDTVPELLAAYRKQPDVSDQALETIAALGPTPEAVVVAREALGGSPYHWIRRAAARLLGAAGPAARDALPEVRKALNELEPEARAWALYAAIRIEGPEPHLEQLRRDLPTPVGDVFVREVVPVLAPTAPEVVPLLLERAKLQPSSRKGSLESNRRAEALIELSKYGAAAREAVPLIVEELGRPRVWHTHPRLCEALEQIGPAAKDALPTLRTVAESPGWRSAHAALKAIKAIEKPQ